MDLTTRLHNKTPHAGGSDPGRIRRIGISDFALNFVLRITLCVCEETSTATIKPAHIFENAEINIDCFTNPETNKITIGISYERGGRSIHRLRLCRWTKDLKTYVWGGCDKMMFKMLKAKHSFTGDLEGQ